MRSHDTTVGSVTVLGRLMQTRGIGAFVVLLCATPLLVALAAYQTRARAHLPDDGPSVDDRLAVEAADARWVGVRKSDRVVALDGVPLATPREWVARSLAHDGPLAVELCRRRSDRPSRGGGRSRART
jgi:hypothetical protein